MAKLSAHGKQLIITGMRYRKAYCSDGKILRDTGGGWKLYAKVKPGFTYETAYQTALDVIAKNRTERPAFFAYVDKLKEYVPSFKKRTMFCMLIDTLGPNEADGIWSEIHDSYSDDMPKDLELDDIVELCQAYEAVEQERAYYQAQKTA